MPRRLRRSTRHIGAGRMTAEELRGRVEPERIVTISEAEWAAVAGSFEQVERRDTFVADDLLWRRIASAWR